MIDIDIDIGHIGLRSESNPKQPSVFNHRQNGSKEFQLYLPIWKSVIKIHQEHW